MTIATIRAQLESQRATIRLVDGKLSLRGPGSALKDSALLELIRTHRDEIIALLHAGEVFDYDGDGADSVPDNLLQPGTLSITPELLPLVDITQAEIDQIVASVPGGAMAIQDVYPLTPLQEGMLFHHIMGEKSDPYLIWGIYAFADRETLDAYVEAFNVVIGRHDILRTCLRWEGLRDPVQIVLRSAKVHIEDLPLDPRDGDLVEQMKSRFGQGPFRLDLRDAPLVKLVVVRDEENDRFLVMRLLHHLTTDRTTGDVVSKEIVAVMAGQLDALPQPVPYRNLVAHVRSAKDHGEHEAFFRRLLGEIEHTTAPFGLLNVHRDGSGIIERESHLDEDVSQRLANVSKVGGVSATSVIHMAWGLMLAKVCHTAKPVFGTVVFGRLKAGGSTDRILGVSINTLPVLVRAEMSVLDCAREVQALLAELLLHEQAPLTATQRASRLPSDVPLFTSVINYRHSGSRDRERFEGDTSGIATDKVSFIGQHEGNNYPLTLSVDEFQGGVKLSIQAARGIDPDLVLSLTVNAIVHILAALESEPSRPLLDIPILTPDEEARVLDLWRGGVASETPDHTILSYVDAQMRATPDRVAIRQGDAALTYAQLDAKAATLAAHLQQAGVRPGTVVGACLERSIDQVCGLLATFKAGGTWLPLDPAYPADRLDYMATDSRTSVLLTTSAHRGLVKASVSATVLIDALEANVPAPTEVATSPDDVAYLLYTSGSTGKPKGVIGLHRMLTNRLLPERAACRGDEVYAQKTSINFIDSFWEIFLPLITGAVIEILPPDVLRDPAEFCEALREKRITHLVLVPTLLGVLTSQLQDTVQGLPSLRYCVSSGEPLSAELARRTRRVLPGTRLMNIYGTTEFWDATAYEVGDLETDSGVPIGTALPGVGIYILDERGRPVPAGVDGELYVSSLGMGPGYIDKDELTARAFVPCPFLEGRSMYRTGDRVRWRDGVGLEYLGRNDRQLNVHGFRIEPGEIEASILDHPGIAEAAVVAIGPDQQLAAYAVAAPDVREDTIPFGIFYFSDAGTANDTDELQLYVESVKEADRLGFEAVWTPERHFTAVGAAFPNPSVLSAAAAMVTRNIQLRSGSVVLPLHDPLRVAEEWAIVDRLSGGRVALSFASGWVPNDFVLAPDNFERRHDVMLESIEQVRALWRGHAIARRNGVGATVEVRLPARPVQAELPTWVTAAGAPRTFADAGRIGANVLTHVLNTTTAGLAEKIAVYRAARKEAGLDLTTGKVAVMLHTFVTEDATAAMAEARPFLETYFRSQLKLRKDVGAALGLEVQTDDELSDEVIGLAVDRFLASKALIGNPESCIPLVRQLYDAGVDEIACLVDFGLPADRITTNLPVLDRLRRATRRRIRSADLIAWLAKSLPAYMRPNSLMLLDRMPLTPSGKIDRLALPDPAGNASRVAHVGPRNAVEQGLADVWMEVLRLTELGVHDRFFDLGGNSVTAIRVINRAQKALGIKVSVRDLFEKQTIAALADLAQHKIAAAPQKSLVRFSESTAKRPFFCVHGVTGDAKAYAKLCRYVDSKVAVYGIQDPALLPGGRSMDSMPELAAHYIGLIKEVQPEGPYQLLGWSFGGLVAHEMACQLQAAGEDVSFLCMLDALLSSSNYPPDWSDEHALSSIAKAYNVVRSAEDIERFQRLSETARDRSELLEGALAILKERQVYPDNARMEDLDAQIGAIKGLARHAAYFQPRTFTGPLLYIGAMGESHDVEKMVARWSTHVDGDIDLVKLDVRHNHMFEAGYIDELGAVIADRLGQSQEALAG